MNTNLIMLILAGVVAIILVVVGGIVALNSDKPLLFELTGAIALFILFAGLILYINGVYSDAYKEIAEDKINALETSADEERTSSSNESVDCEKCNKQYNIEYKFCPECGAELSK